ncbi:3-deoxy-7-phosphoheptulonate synthase, partial [Patescibacteria group bacterium]
HAMGRRDLVTPMCKMAIPGGVNGFLIETHPEPEKAICDGQQSLNFEEFESLYSEMKQLTGFMDKSLI